MTNLIPRILFGELDLTDSPFSIEFDYDLGSGTLNYETLVSLLLDGELVSASRASNRELTFRVLVEGADLAEIATNTATLALEADRSANTLSIDPGDGFAAVTVFETFRAQLTPQHSEAYEAANLRAFELTLPAKPHARSMFATTQPAVAAVAGVVVDDGTSTTGWSTTYGTLSTSGGAIVNTSTRDNWARETRTGTVDMAGFQYIAVEWSASVPIYIEAGSGGTSWPEVYREKVGANNRSYFAAGMGVDFGSFWLAQVQGLTAGSMTFSIHEVTKVATLPDSDTGGHQQTLTLAGGGSAQTQGEFDVTTATNGLGEVVLFTSRAGDAYTPTCRRNLVSSDTVIDSPGGDYQTIAGASIYRIPVSTLPLGGYTVWARMACTTTDNVDIVWNAQTFVGSSTVGDYQGDTTRCEFVANDWKMYPLGQVTLPPAHVGPAGTIQIGIQRSAAAPNDTKTVYLHDVFLFHESGDLTVVECGTGTSSAGGASSRRMRILPPSAETPGGAVEIGHAVDWSDVRGAGSAASARPARGHVIHPEGTSVFVYTESTPDGTPADVSASWFLRWHTHVGG